MEPRARLGGRPAARGRRRVRVRAAHAPRVAGAGLLRVPRAVHPLAARLARGRRRRRVPAQRRLRGGRRRPVGLPAGRVRPAVHRRSSRRLAGLPRRAPGSRRARRAVRGPAPELGQCPEQAAARRGSGRGAAAGAVRPAREAEARVRHRPARGGEGPQRRPQERRAGDWRPGQRQERHRAVAHGRAGTAWPHGGPRDGLPVVHPDPAQGRRRPVPRHPAAVQVLQRLHGRRPQRPRRARPRRGPPHPGDVRQPVDAQGAAQREPPAARRADRRCPGAGVPAGRAPGGAAGRAGHGPRHRVAREVPRAGGAPRRPRRAVPLRRQLAVRRVGAAPARPGAGRARRVERATTRSRC